MPRCLCIHYGSFFVYGSILLSNVRIVHCWTTCSKSLQHDQCNSEQLRSTHAMHATHATNKLTQQYIKQCSSSIPFSIVWNIYAVNTQIQKTKLGNLPSKISEFEFHICLIFVTNLCIKIVQFVWIPCVWTVSDNDMRREDWLSSQMKTFFCIISYFFSELLCTGALWPRFVVSHIEDKLNAT